MGACCTTPMSMGSTPSLAASTSASSASSSEDFRWCSIDPKTGKRCQYEQSVMNRIEAEYQTPGFGAKRVVITLLGKRFTVRLPEMVQVNGRGGARKVCRVPNAPPRWVSSPLLSPSTPPLHPTAAPAQWVSVEPGTMIEVRYSPQHAAVLEEAYQTPGYAPAYINFEAGTYSVCFKSMRQSRAEDASRWRTVKRYPNDPPHWFPRSPVATPKAPVLTRKDCAAALAAIEKAEGHVEKVMATVRRGIPYSLGCAASEELVAPVTKIYEVILRVLRSRRYQDRYECKGFEDTLLLADGPGQQVPSYFANLMQGASIYRRKALSLLGLRNLVGKGFPIFTQLQRANFSGQLEDYLPDTGLHALKYFTGNTVDLDTTILRCNDFALLAYVNASNKAEGRPTYDSAAAFAKSDQARSMAFDQARLLTDKFIAELGIGGNAAALAARHVDLPRTLPRNYTVPVSEHNHQRGQHPMWRYVAQGRDSYHVNVPDMPDVYGALLRAPWQAAKAFCKIQLLDCSEEKREAWVDRFYEECISDSCLNAKWKAVEAFNATFDYEVECDARPTVRFQLERLQMDNQAAYVAVENDDEELKVTMKMIAATGLKGWLRSGEEVPITAAMVQKWMDQPDVDF